MLETPVFDVERESRARERTTRPMLRALIAFEEWVAAGKCMIRSRKNNRVEPLVPNKLQLRLHAKLKRQAANRVPVRLIGLKGRKMGFSTWVQALWRFLCSYFPYWLSVTLAHVGPETVQLFNIAKLIHRKADDGGELDNKGEQGQKIKFENGSEYFCRTGGGVYVLSSGTHNAVHVSELGKWQGSEQMVGDQMLSILQSVPDSEMSIVIIESTANQSDTSGEFERRWSWAMAGHGEFEHLFVPWFDDADYKIAIKYVLEHDSDEKALVARFGLTDEQLAWRRRKIATDFNGDVVRFKQEYPSTPEEAFQVSRGKIFPALNAAKHTWRVELEQLIASGFEFYRGVDFGGADPFVCVGIAHRPGSPGFTIDHIACTEAWREFTSYQRDLHGRPQDRNNHVPDAVRYVVQQYDLCGHVHIYKLLYQRDTAHHGKSVVDMAAEIKHMWATEESDVLSTTADRTRPDSITLLNQQSIPTCPARTPETIRLGEIEDGISKLHALMLATIPLIHPPPPMPRPHVLLTKRQNSEFEYSNTMETAMEIGEYERAKGFANLEPVCGGGFFI